MSIDWNNLDPKNLKVGVVGGGNMGSGIAQKYATEGFQTVVIDVDEASAQKARERVAATMDEGVKRGIFKAEIKDQILGRMTFTADKTVLKDAALVVEAIFEDKAVKQALFKELDGICAPDTILATNTSSFYVDDVAETVTQKDRVVGLHYFYHPAKNRLVEVIAGKATSKESYDRAWALQELAGKTPIDSKDAPGFVVNRFFVPWLNESMRIVMEGAADIATVEAASKKTFGVGMGPFELMNVTGVPITLHAATTLGAELGDFYKPCDLIRPVVERKENWPLDGLVDASKLQSVGERLLGVVFQIACKMVLEEKVCTLEDCDLGARVGLRWPKGPFELMNDLGTEKARMLVENIAKRYADVSVPKPLADQAATGKPFPFHVVRTRVENGVGYLTIDRPDAMNALSEAVFTQLDDGFKILDADPSVKGIVVEGRGKAFVAGADVRYFVEQIEANDVPRIVKYASGGQAIFRRIDQSKKTVVCKLHGLSLGGGSELALACDYIVATSKGTVGFPETGIGIYPGLGGTQRSPRRIGVPLARWLVLTGHVVDAKTAHAMGLVDEVVAANDLEATVRTWALEKAPRDENTKAPPVPGAFVAWANAFDGDLTSVKEGKTEVSGDDKDAIAKTIGRLAHKAPIALEMADDLVGKALTWSLEAGLKAESDGLARIFSTDDALEGMRSLGRGRPSFKGS